MGVSACRRPAPSAQSTRSEGTPGSTQGAAKVYSAGMAGTPLSRDLYDRMVAAYRECPGNHSRAARAVGVDRRMTTRAWLKGWPRYAWARPVSAVLAEEHDTARSRLAAVEQRALAERQAERDKASVASVEARTEEEQLLRAARRDVLGVLVIAAELTPAVRVLGRLVMEAITLLARQIQAGGGELTPKQIGQFVEIVDRHARLVSKAVYAADAVLKLSRLERGEPGYLVGVRADALDEQAEKLSEAEALAELRHGRDLLEEMLREGALPAELEQVVEASAAGLAQEDAPALPPGASS